ncbi:Hypothetical predicted protein [Cloeon dipterum]|uniref:C2H2-type domain-containing protein n=1 Tax=Cloeon dipterum TaxID=197152 RepID=A0A8S1E3U9_9INSE|nr:Hypothetical predicted protein [Cloeon dipterum]
MAFQCSNFLCVAVFTSQAELDAHYQANHAKADSLKSFRCDKCEFRCNNWNNLDRHVKHMHEEKTVRCFLCSKMFPSERAMSTHVNDCHITKHCRFCDLRVPVIERSRHQQAVHCDRCDKSFPCAGTNNMHNRYCVASLPVIKTEIPEIPEKDPSDDEDDDDDESQFLLTTHNGLGTKQSNSPSVKRRSGNVRNKCWQEPSAMSQQRTLCIICVRPTADGGVSYAQIDKEKLKTWLQINCDGQELPKNVKDKNLICYFCIWQAEFLAKSVNGAESLAWWPKNIEYDCDRKQLRKNFLEGNADQCWVQLKVIELPKSEKEKEKIVKKPQTKLKRMCVYCCFEFNLSDLRVHTKTKHKDFIKCDRKRCLTYFLKTEDKEKHMRECNVTPPKKQNVSKRSICDVEEAEKISEIPENTVNPDPESKCTPQGCDHSSQTETENHEPVLPSHQEEKEKADAKKTKLDTVSVEKALPSVQEPPPIIRFSIKPRLPSTNLTRK